MLKTKKQLAAEFTGLALAITVIVLIVMAICSITVPAKAEEGIGFPSYWEFDAKLVRSVQKRLNYYDADLKIDGDFGPATAQAVKNFQKQRGLPVTGVVDDNLAMQLGINRSWPDGTTLYYMADLEEAYAIDDYEDLIYIALGGRGNISTICLFRDGKLIGTKDWEKVTDLPVGVFTLGDLRETYKIIIVDNFMYWLYDNEPDQVTLVIDDRAYQPYNAPSYKDLLEDTDYADWD